MDKIFEKLYDNFVEEAQGAAAYAYNNDIVGYEEWYKGHLFVLCIKYKNLTQRRGGKKEAEQGGD